MKLREKILTTLLTTVLLVSGCSGCRHKTAPQVPTDALQDIEDGHRHATPDTPIPSVPQNDPFFDSIVFPDKPLLDDYGHYRPKNPFKIPNAVKSNPRLFITHENGYWSVNESKEYNQRYEQVNQGLTEQAYSRKLAEALSEGLEPFVAYLFLSANGLGSHSYATELIDKAYAQNPNDYDTLTYWCLHHWHDKPDEVEAVYRRLVQMRPDDLRTLYNLGTFIVHNHDDPSEAIPYLEKAYRLKPDWANPILFLGEAYFRLRKFEKSLRYLQAYQRFAGTHHGPAADYIAAIYTILGK